ncbi:contactin-associated protein like 5-4-like [Rattus rattus]|uniref:contactin-associated protein like 5-4-like n=1 Tax=Rattus rattus TaxID=10117 RepID=UPI0013F2EF3C|nr:contactin-associated protein like 5-4-like [Rattus rattus]
MGLLNTFSNPELWLYFIFLQLDQQLFTYNFSPRVEFWTLKSLVLGKVTDPIGKRDEREPLTDTVQSDSAVIGGIIALVTFVTFCVIGIMIRFLYLHKQSHCTNQTKEKEYPENLCNSFRNAIDLQNTASECKREYFI